MKARLLLILFLGVMAFSSCDVEDTTPEQEIEQVRFDNGHEEDENTTSGEGV